MTPNHPAVSQTLEAQKHKKIFISSPRSTYLCDEGDNRKGFKKALIERIKGLGYKLEYYDPGVPDGGGGKAGSKQWDPKEAQQIIAGCSGMVLIGFRFWSNCLKAGDKKKEPQKLVTEYCQYEGAIARNYNIPVFPLLEDGIEGRLMYLPHLNEEVVPFPENADKSWIEADSFDPFLERWRVKVEERHDLFIGYCSKAKDTAKEIIRYLKDRYSDLDILDWTEFKQSDFILNRIEDACNTCTAAIFLFTKDDFFPKGTQDEAGDIAVPRDNVVFETGYFINAKGKERVQLIVETGTKVLSDLEGFIYTPLEKKEDISSIHERLNEFIDDHL